MKPFTIISLIAAGLLLAAVPAKAQEGPFWESHPHSFELSAGYPITIVGITTSAAAMDKNGITRKIDFASDFGLAYSFRVSKRWEFVFAVDYGLMTGLTSRYPLNEDSMPDFSAEPDVTRETNSLLTAGMSARFYWVERPVWRLYSNVGYRVVLNGIDSSYTMLPEINLLGVRIGKGHLYGLLDFMPFNGPMFFLVPRFGLGWRL